MPAALPPAGTDGLPPLSLRAFQYIDRGYSVWSAFWTAFNEWLQALERYLGAQVAVDIGEIR